MTKQRKSYKKIGGKHIKPVGGYMVYVKPLSVNQAWLGRKRKSAAYRQYETELLSVTFEILETTKLPVELNV